MSWLRMREAYEKEEAELLAPFAIKSAESQGRLAPETEHPHRTAFQRDRDRVIHCRAFRRLEYKTQVFVFHEDDHYRNRLTHTHVERDLFEPWYLHDVGQAQLLLEFWPDLIEVLLM